MITVDDPPNWVLLLPAVNAGLNALATAQLVLGYVLVRRRHLHAHRNVMISAFATSVLFLTSYLIYHAHELTKPFEGTGPIRVAYFVILISHVILAALVPWMALLTLYQAFRGQWRRHRRTAKVTFPIWLYVSVTGVVIYLMLYHYNG
ncbi:MAG: DUF420 domain-containing protein [Planctomycetaceae bacterium]